MQGVPLKTSKHPHTLIVGGSKGLGLALAAMLAKQGHKVSVLSRTAPRTTKNVRHVKADIGNIDELAAVLRTLAKEKGGVDNLVFVQRHRGAAGDGKDDAWNGEVGTSLTATKMVVETLAPRMKQGGSIVMVTSVADKFIADEQPVGYHVAKAGLAHMSRYYAVTLAAKGIRCNTVSPSFFIKEQSREFHGAPKRAAFYKRIIPMGRPAEMAEICNVIAFLCSPGAAYVTGQNISVDGGVSAQAHLTLAEKAAN